MSSILGFAKVLVDDHCTRCRLTLAVDEVCWYGPDTCRAPNPYPTTLDGLLGALTLLVASMGSAAAARRVAAAMDADW